MKRGRRGGGGVDGDKKIRRGTESRSRGAGSKRDEGGRKKEWVDRKK